ncbi:hypothetical protein [Nocardia gipuzkoensis]
MSASSEFLSELNELREMAHTDWGTSMTDYGTIIREAEEGIEKLAAAAEVARGQGEFGTADSIAILSGDMFARLQKVRAVQFAHEQAAELQRLGGTAAARQGWEALRKHNPNHDGATDFPTFEDLPHAKKVEYATFAKGVLTGLHTLDSMVNQLRWTYTDGSSVTLPV